VLNVLIKQCQQSGYTCFCTLKQYTIYANNTYLETLNPNQHPPTKKNPWYCTIIFLSQIEKWKALESKHCQHLKWLIILWTQPCVLIFFNIDAWNKVPIVFSVCFEFWGSQNIDYIELIYLVEGPFSAKLNQHGSLVFSKCL
jgi:hypothetical protein